MTLTPWYPSAYLGHPKAEALVSILRPRYLIYPPPNIRPESADPDGGTRITR